MILFLVLKKSLSIPCHYLIFSSYCFKLEQLSHFYATNYTSEQTLLESPGKCLFLFISLFSSEKKRKTKQYCRGKEVGKSL